MAALARFLPVFHCFRRLALPRRKTARFRVLTVLLLWGAGAAGILGCSSAPQEDDGTGGAPPTPGAESLAFRPSDTLLLGPGEMGSLAVQVEPPGFHTVSFSLVANPSDSAFDGFLESASVVTDSSGWAHNILQAPTSASLFVVRATVGESLLVTRTVSVSNEGFATLVGVPTYTGIRDVDSWSAAATVGVTCSQLPTIWEAGALQAVGTEDRVTLSGVPVGPTIALVVRAGQYVGGCVTVTGLGAGEERQLDVGVTDRPLQLSGTSISISLDVEEQAPSFVAHLAAAAATGAVDFSRGYGDDADVLVADVAEAIQDEDVRAAFLERADEFGYADMVRVQLPSPEALRDAVLAQLLDAASKIDGPGVFMLAAELDGSSPTLVLGGAAGVPTAKSGFLGSSDLSVVREPADRLVLGADLEFQATRWLGAIAENTFDPAPLELLDEVLDCTSIGAAWADAAEGEATCDEACEIELCRAGLRTGWNRARTTARELSTLRVGISGQVSVDNQARPTALRGDWVGSIDSGDLGIAGAAQTPGD